MEVDIGDFKSTVRAVDGDSLLSPATMEKILRVVLQAVDEREAHRMRVRGEQHVSYGMGDEPTQME